MSDFEAIMAAAKKTKQEIEPAKKTQPKSKSSVWDDLIPAKERTKRLNLDIPESTDKSLKDRADKLNLSKSALVRRLIDSYLENTD